MRKERILVVGAGGQIGTVLTQALRDTYGASNVVASDMRPLPTQYGPTAVLNAMDRSSIEQILHYEKITQIYHLAAILSARGEQSPLESWQLNMGTLFNVFEAARNQNITKVYYPSSIAVFGEGVNRQNTEQYSSLIPATVYGISKVAGENWANYYHKRYGMDIRGLRYPGIIGYQSLPGGGTTDYAVDIYHAALKNEPFSCFLEQDTRLPMMYMDDAIRATIELMEAPAEQIKCRTAYNLAAMSFTPAEIAASIQRHIPDFQISYAPDFRQGIAASWPEVIDDSHAQRDWGWKPAFNLERMTAEMLLRLGEKFLDDDQPK
jgi:threonine 3-dehydrogenase